MGIWIQDTQDKSLYNLLLSELIHRDKIQKTRENREAVTQEMVDERKLTTVPSIY